MGPRRGGRAEYSGGKFEVALLTAFDAYGNDFAGVPEIEWDDPADGEVRYYIFTQTFTYPGRGETGGWDAVFDIEGAELEAAEVFGEYSAMRISGTEAGGRAELSFGEETRSFEIEAEAEEIAEYKIGVVACQYLTELDSSTIPPTITSHFFCKWSIKNISAYQIEESNTIASTCEEIGFTNPKENEVMLLVFVNKELSPETDWNFSSDKGTLEFAGTVGNYDCYSVLRTMPDRRKDITVNISLELSDSKLLVLATIHPSNRGVDIVAEK